MKFKIKFFKVNNFLHICVNEDEHYSKNVPHTHFENALLYGKREIILEIWCKQENYLIN